MSAPLRPASTVALVRPSDTGLEVFLVRRHDDVAFMGGAHVFPGGRVDAADRLDEPDRWCDGPVDTRMRGRTEADAHAFLVAAARELFEEAGVLLARDASGAMVSIAGDAVARFDTHRRRLLASELRLIDILAGERLRLALDALALFAHWLTPLVDVRRLDTYFFLADAPASQDAAHCRHETTAGLWIRPLEAIDRCRRGDIALPPPTWTTLRALSRLGAVDAAWQWAKAQTVPPVQPCFRLNGDGSRLVMLPGDPLCPAVEGFAAEETRFLLDHGRWRPIDPVR